MTTTILAPTGGAEQPRRKATTVSAPLIPGGSVAWHLDHTHTDPGARWRRTAITHAGGLHHLVPAEALNEGLALTPPRPGGHHHYVFGDSNLSFRARGLATALILLPAGSPASTDALAEHGAEGHAALRTVMAELARAGYLRAEQRVPVHGKAVNGVTISCVPLRDWSTRWPLRVAVYADPMDEDGFGSWYPTPRALRGDAR